jgi:hypothetical protein
MAEVELRLDEAIDSLNAGAESAAIDGDLEELVALARALRVLRGEEWPDPDFPPRLVGELANELAPAWRWRRRSRVRVAFGLAAGVAAVVALVVAITLNRAGPVDAATLAREALAASSGEGLGPIRFTQLVTNSLPHGVFVPAPPPPRVVEHVLVASSDRWRVEATITRPDGEGTTHVLTVRNGATIVTVVGSPGQGKTESRRAAGNDSGLPSASAYGAQIDMLSLLAQTSGRCARKLSPVQDGPRIAGRATQLLRVGATPCPSAAMPELNGPATFVVDRQTHLVLQADTRSASGQLTQRLRTARLVTGGALPARLFRLPKPLPKAAHSDHPGTAFTPSLPSHLPAGLHAGPITPVATEPSDGKTIAFTVTYRDAHGHARLQLYEAAASTPSVRYPGRHVQIRAGITGTYLDRNGLRILWWIHDGIYLSLQEGGSAAGVPLTGSYPLATLLAIARST